MRTMRAPPQRDLDHARWGIEYLSALGDLDRQMEIDDLSVRGV